MSDRSTGEVLVLLIAATICGYVITVGMSVIIFQFIHPEEDATAAFRSVSNIINTMVGLLAGFLAGRTGSKKSDDEEQK